MLGKVEPKIYDYDSLSDTWGGLPKTKALARAVGAKLYFTGSPCSRGHIVPRYASIGQCVRCRSDKSRALKKTTRVCIAGDASLSDRILQFSMPVPECGCWIWMLSTTRKSYGQLTYRKKHLEAHRASWMAFRGAIPHDRYVLHRCNISLCVNPDHLYLGTERENCADRKAAGTFKPPPRFSGEQHPMAKLTESIVREVKAAKGTIREISARTGIKPSTVGAIRSGRTWKEISL